MFKRGYAHLENRGARGTRSPVVEGSDIQPQCKLEIRDGIQ